MLLSLLLKQANKVAPVFGTGVGEKVDGVSLCCRSRWKIVAAVFFDVGVGKRVVAVGVGVGYGGVAKW